MYKKLKLFNIQPSRIMTIFIVEALFFEELLVLLLPLVPVHNLSDRIFIEEIQNYCVPCEYSLTKIMPFTRV